MLPTLSTLDIADALWRDIKLLCQIFSKLTLNKSFTNEANLLWGQFVSLRLFS